jgi:hypothetical protein
MNKVKFNLIQVYVFTLTFFHLNRFFLDVNNFFIFLILVVVVLSFSLCFSLGKNSFYCIFYLAFILNFVIFLTLWGHNNAFSCGTIFRNLLFFVSISPLPFMAVSLSKKLFFLIFVFFLYICVNLFDLSILETKALFFLFLVFSLSFFLIGFLIQKKTCFQLTLYFVLYILICTFISLSFNLILKQNTIFLVFCFIFSLFTLLYNRKKVLFFYLNSLNETALAQYLMRFMIVLSFIILKTMISNVDLGWIFEFSLILYLPYFIFPIEIEMMDQVDDVYLMDNNPFNSWTFYSKPVQFGKSLSSGIKSGPSSSLFTLQKRSFIGDLKVKSDEILKLNPKCIGNHQVFVADKNLNDLSDTVKYGILTSTRNIYESKHIGFYGATKTVFVAPKNVRGADTPQYLSNLYYTSTKKEFFQLTEKSTIQQQEFNTLYQSELEEALDRTKLNQNKHSLKQQIAVERKTESRERKK